jgi:hypothetical protein
VDLNELLKSAPHLQSIATTIVAGVPLAEIVKRIVLPSADALGKRMADRVERCFAKTAKMIEDAGVTPQPVEDKLVVEILRAASLEDNEDLHTMWAALLANAASPEDADNVRPGFIALLREMAPDEAALLTKVANANETLVVPQVQGNTKAELSRQIAFRDVALLMTVMTVVRRDFAHDGEVESALEIRFQTCLELLQRAGLISSNGTGMSLSALGERFLEAVRPPKPKE